jgi:hypothetical protein
MKGVGCFNTYSVECIGASTSTPVETSTYGQVNTVLFTYRVSLSNIFPSDKSPSYIVENGYPGRLGIYFSFHF